MQDRALRAEQGADSVIKHPSRLALAVGRKDRADPVLPLGPKDRHGEQHSGRGMSSQWAKYKCQLGLESIL